MNKPKLQVGQRWLWDGRLLAEIIPSDLFAHNAIVLDIRGTKKCFGIGIGKTFNIIERVSSWEYLEGQDAIQN
jgi:hypothetical protein